jgi:hypothetical protein
MTEDDELTITANAIAAQAVRADLAYTIAFHEHAMLYGLAEANAHRDEIRGAPETEYPIWRTRLDQALAEDPAWQRAVVATWPHVPKVWPPDQPERHLDIGRPTLRPAVIATLVNATPPHQRVTTLKRLLGLTPGSRYARPTPRPDGAVTSQAGGHDGGHISGRS